MKKFIKILALVLILIFVFTLPALAITEAEVQDEVDKVGKEAVTGNILVWFLCAIAFLKVSQKIDSFMSSLGVNVGHTGGSMLAEAIIAARGVGMVGSVAGGKGFSFGGFGKGGSSPGSSGNGSIFKGGLAGVVNRGVTNNAVKNANGTKSGGLGGKIYDSSVSKGGNFANRVIGNIANGDVRSTGTISGEGASEALMSYMGFTALGENSEDTPSFSNVEIGGGRITGTETSSANPEGIGFAMYSADQYSAPEGDYSTVTSADGTNWYKQYAQDTIVQRPFAHPDGYIDRGETIEKRMPKAPQRKDRH